MDYKIVVDSCGELTEEMKQSGNVVSIPLTLQIDDEMIIDDETFDQAEFLKKVAASPNCPKSACPSPEMFVKSFEGEAKRVYVVTISANLSGTYNSAMLAKQMYEEGSTDKEIYVFDSKSASVAEMLIADRIMECEGKGMPFEEIVKEVEAYIYSQKVTFVLESLDALRKNGRLTGLKALVATALNIKPIMSADDDGVIYQKTQARGVNKSISKLVECVVEEMKKSGNKVLAISHCNCKERAETVLKMIGEKIEIHKSFILDTRGVSSLYASQGGIIVVV